MRAFMQIFGVFVTIMFLVQAVLGIDISEPQLAASSGSNTRGSNSGNAASNGQASSGATMGFGTSGSASGSGNGGSSSSGRSGGERDRK